MIDIEIQHTAPRLVVCTNLKSWLMLGMRLEIVQGVPLKFFISVQCSGLYGIRISFCQCQTCTIPESPNSTSFYFDVTFLSIATS